MNLLDIKKNMVKNKKEELPPHVIEMGLNMLFVEPINVFERIENGLKDINTIDDIEELYNITNKATVLIDIRDKKYNEALDNIALAKQSNEQLCVIVRDILLEEYQVYLSRVYQIDGLLFDVSHLTTQMLKNIMFIAISMGITPILSINSEMDISKIDWEITRVVAVKDKNIINKIPNNIKIIKDIDANFDSADVVIKEK